MSLQRYGEILLGLILIGASIVMMQAMKKTTILGIVLGGNTETVYGWITAVQVLTGISAVACLVYTVLRERGWW